MTTLPSKKGFEHATVLRANSGCILIAWWEEGEDGPTDQRLCIRQYAENKPDKTFRLSEQEAKTLVAVIDSF